MAHSERGFFLATAFRLIDAVPETQFCPPPPLKLSCHQHQKKTLLLRASSGLYHLDGRVYNGHLVPPTAKKADAFNNYFVEKIETLNKGYM